MQERVRERGREKGGVWWGSEKLSSVGSLEDGYSVGEDAMGFDSQGALE